MTPLDFLKTVIAAWEGLYGANPDDAGNWAHGWHGERQLDGTMRGVTPDALAAHRGIDPATLTPEIMKTVTLEEAAEIGMIDFYDGPHFNLLTWGPATAALLDFGWGAGPGQAVKSMQRLVGATPDGQLGPLTAKAYNDWLAGTGEARALQAIHDMRAAFYRLVADRHPEDQQFLQGWLNRDDWASGPQFLAKWTETT